MTRRLCAHPGCIGAATSGPRCPEHTGDHERGRNARRRGRPGDGAAVRLRRLISAAGHAQCARCGALCRAADLEVDHRRALADGGADVAANVQPLCIPCHRGKTAAENRGRSQGVAPGDTTGAARFVRSIHDRDR